MRRKAAYFRHITKECKKDSPLERLKFTEWSARFIQFMRNRMITGALRYGVLCKDDKPEYDRINSMRKRLDLFCSDGNAEHLVDVAALAMCMFEEGEHDFVASDGGHHTSVKGDE